jgi:hypothetical protein
VWLVVGNADPETRTGLVYSLTGPGTTPIEWLNVSLDIAAPLLIREKRTNENGWLVVRIDTADGVASPRPIWFQAIQSGQVSNVIGTRIIP